MSAESEGLSLMHLMLQTVESLAKFHGPAIGREISAEPAPDHSGKKERLPAARSLCPSPGNLMLSAKSAQPARDQSGKKAGSLPAPLASRRLQSHGKTGAPGNGRADFLSENGLVARIDELVAPLPPERIVWANGNQHYTDPTIIPERLTKEHKGLWLERVDLKKHIDHKKLQQSSTCIEFLDSAIQRGGGVVHRTMLNSTPPDGSPPSLRSPSDARRVTQPAFMCNYTHGLAERQSNQSSKFPNPWNPRG